MASTSQEKNAKGRCNGQEKMEECPNFEYHPVNLEYAKSDVKGRALLFGWVLRGSDEFKKWSSHIPEQMLNNGDSGNIGSFRFQDPGPETQDMKTCLAGTCYLSLWKPSLRSKNNLQTRVFLL